MLTRIRIDGGMPNDQEISFLLATAPDAPLGTPSGKMITDSEEMTFVYLLDEEEGYGQIHFTQAAWPLMVAALNMENEPVISYEEETITLVGFKEELTMLIFNIEGNHNYGEAFTSVVEEVFAEVLQSIE